VPLSVGNEVGGVAAVVALELQIDAAHVVRPRAELHLAHLVVERKPRDVDLAGAEEESRRHPQTVAARRHHHVRRKRAVDVLVGAIQVHATQVSSLTDNKRRQHDCVSVCRVDTVYDSVNVYSAGLHSP